MSPSPGADPSASGWRTALLLLVVLGALVLLAAACGDATKAGSATTSTTAPDASVAASRAKLVACLEAHGVPPSVADAPLGGFGPRASDSTSTTVGRSEYAAAFAACRSFLPSRLGSGGFRDSAAAKAYLDCLEQHGVTIPSNPTSFGSVAASPDFKTAQSACADLRPSLSGPANTPSTNG